MAEVETADIAENVDEVRDRRPSNASSIAREKPVGGEPTAKRPRVWAGEDKKRGQRLMGNLLGTLSKFKGEETTRAATAKARQRDEVATKVANKIREENQRMHEVHSFERERRACRIEIDRKEFELRAKELSTRTRAKQLPGLSHFLLTTSSWASDTYVAGLPLSLPPAMDRSNAEKPKPLFYKPRILLPEQEEAIKKQVESTEMLIAEEQLSLSELRSSTAEAVKDLTVRVDTAIQKLKEFGATPSSDALNSSSSGDVAMITSTDVAEPEPMASEAKLESEEDDVKMNDEEVEY